MPRTRARGLLSPWAKVAVFVCAAVPAVWLIGAAATDRLGANPAESLLRGTGDWTLRLLCVTLAISPLRRGLQQPALARFRRMLGLYTFFYAVLHALAWAWLDQGFEWADMVRDIAKRPFILVGFTAFVLLVPLAATSFNRAIRTLGARRWQRLHRLVYAVAGLALLHFFWMRAGKNDDAEVAVYAALVALLLAERSLHFFKKNAVLPASTGH